MADKYTIIKVAILKECPICGGRVESIGGGIYKCTKCGMTFVLGKVEDKLVELLDR